MSRPGIRSTTIAVDEDSYLVRLPSGTRSAFIRAAVDHRLDSLRAVRGWLLAHSDDQVCDLIRDSDRPIREMALLDSDLASLAEPEREAVCHLANECELTGLDPEQLLAELKGGAHA